MSRDAAGARIAAVGGTALAAALPAVLAPTLTSFGNVTGPWRGGFLMGGVAVAVGVGLWSRRALPDPGTWPANRRPTNRADADPTLRTSPLAHQLARVYPFRLARLLFGIAVLASIATIFALAPALGVTNALLPGVIVYLTLLLPISGLYFLTGRLLRPLASAPADMDVPSGERQAIGLRLTLAVQLPVLLCALGMVLVEQTAGGRYEQTIEQYGRDRYGRLLQDVLNALPTDPARQTLLTTIEPPEGVLVFEQTQGRRTFAIASTEGLSARPAALQIPLLFLALGVVLVTVLHGRWLPREITNELLALRQALDALKAGRDPSTPQPYALQETADLAHALERALAGFEARRRALSAAAAERRDSERRKAVFLGHLSHELKSPLNSILGFSDLLLAGIDGPLRPRQRAQLAAVWRQGESLERFILALLDTARLGEAGRSASPLTPAAVSLVELAAAVRDQLRADPLEARKVEVCVLGPATCRIDSTYTARAIRLLQGLLCDRIDAGRIRITFQPAPSGGVVEIQILDEAQADPAEREALRRALTERGGDDQAGAVPATWALLDALARAQGSVFEAVMKGESAWPRLLLTLPGADGPSIQG